MAPKTILGIKPEQLSRNEKRRRIAFFVKLLGYAILLVLLVAYTGSIKETTFFGKVVTAALFYLTGHLIVTLSRMVIVNLYIRKHKLKKEMRNNFILGIDRVATVINSLIFIIAALSLFEVSLAQLFTGISIVAAAIAILSKDYISNMINGLIIMFSDQLSLGDYVRIGEHKGKITDITLLNIHIVNDDEDLVYIPNNMVFNSDVVNFSKQKIKKATIEFEIGADKANRLHGLENYLKENLRDYSGSIKKDSYTLKVAKITKDMIQLKYQFVFQKENRETEKKIRRELPRKVIDFFRISEEETAPTGVLNQ